MINSCLTAIERSKSLKSDQLYIENDMSFNEEKDDGNIGILNSQKRTRAPFSKEEDEKLLKLVKLIGIKNKNVWHMISKYMNGRNVRQCRERYNLYLQHTVRRKDKWTKEEDEILLYNYSQIGPHWKAMEKKFEGRTQYNIKNRFSSLIRSQKNKDKLNLYKLFHVNNNMNQEKSIIQTQSSTFSQTSKFQNNDIEKHKNCEENANDFKNDLDQINDEEIIDFDHIFDTNSDMNIYFDEIFTENIFDDF